MIGFAGVHPNCFAGLNAKNCLYSFSVALPHVGNSIIGASCSDKQMLCGPSRARAVNNIQEGRFVIRRINLILWHEISKQ